MGEMIALELIAGYAVLMFIIGCVILGAVLGAYWRERRRERYTTHHTRGKQ